MNGFVIHFLCRISKYGIAIKIKYHGFYFTILHFEWFTVEKKNKNNGNYSLNIRNFARKVINTR